MADNETYLDKSAYPIEPNTQIDNLPDPNPTEIDTGVDVDVSSSQAPAPDDTQNVDTAPVETVEEGPQTETQEDGSPFSTANQGNHYKEKMALGTVLKDLKDNLNTHYSQNGFISEDLQDNMNEIVLEMKRVKNSIGKIEFSNKITDLKNHHAKNNLLYTGEDGIRYTLPEFQRNTAEKIDARMVEIEKNLINPEKWVQRTLKVSEHGTTISTKDTDAPDWAEKFNKNVVDDKVGQAEPDPIPASDIIEYEYETVHSTIGGKPVVQRFLKVPDNIKLTIPYADGKISTHPQKAEFDLKHLSGVLNTMTHLDKDWDINYVGKASDGSEHTLDFNWTDTQIELATMWMGEFMNTGNGDAWVYAHDALGMNPDDPDYNLSTITRIPPPGMASWAYLSREVQPHTQDAPEWMTDYLDWQTGPGSAGEAIWGKEQAEVSHAAGTFFINMLDEWEPMDIYNDPRFEEMYPLAVTQANFLQGFKQEYSWMQSEFDAIQVHKSYDEYGDEIEGGASVSITPTLAGWNTEDLQRELGYFFMIGDDDEWLDGVRQVEGKGSLIELLSGGASRDWATQTDVWLKNPASDDEIEYLLQYIPEEDHEWYRKEWIERANREGILSTLSSFEQFDAGVGVGIYNFVNGWTSPEGIASLAAFWYRKPLIDAFLRTASGSAGGSWQSLRLRAPWLFLLTTELADATMMGHMGWTHGSQIYDFVDYGIETGWEEYGAGEISQFFTEQGLGITMLAFWLRHNKRSLTGYKTTRPFTNKKGETVHRKIQIEPGKVRQLLGVNDKAYITSSDPFRGQLQVNIELARNGFFTKAEFMKNIEKIEGEHLAKGETLFKNLTKEELWDYATNNEKFGGEAQGLTFKKIEKQLGIEGLADNVKHVEVVPLLEKSKIDQTLHKAATDKKAIMQEKVAKIHRESKAEVDRIYKETNVQNKKVETKVEWLINEKTQQAEKAVLETKTVKELVNEALVSGHKEVVLENAKLLKENGYPELAEQVVKHQRATFELNEGLAARVKTDKEMKTRANHEIALNKEKDIHNTESHGGNIIITMNSGEAPWNLGGKPIQSIRVNPKTGEYWVNYLPEKWQAGKDGGVDYFGEVQADGQSFSIKPGEKFAYEVYGGKFNKTLTTRLNTFLTQDKIQFKAGETRIGKDGETYMFINDKIGFRNLKKDGFDSNTTLEMWYETAKDFNSPMWENNISVKEALFNIKKDIISSAYSKIEKVSFSFSKSKKFSQPSNDKGVYTGDVNIKLGSIKEAIIIKEQIGGSDAGALKFQPFDKQPKEVVKLQTEIARKWEAGEYKNDFNNPEVIRAFERFEAQTLEQAQALIKKGNKAEFHKGEGEPYKNSAEINAAIANGESIKVLPSSKAFGPWNGEPVTVEAFLRLQYGGHEKVPGHLWKWINNKEQAYDPVTQQFHPLIVKHFPMLKSTDIIISGERATLNDIFRWTHDMFGHGVYGNGHGVKGENIAYLSHAEMYDTYGRYYLFSQTVAQNSKYNYGENKGEYTPQFSFIDRKSMHLYESMFTVDAPMPNVSRFGWATKNKVGATKYIKSSTKPDANSGETGNFFTIAQKTEPANLNWFIERVGENDVFLGKNVKEFLTEWKSMPANKRQAEMERLLRQLQAKYKEEGLEISFRPGQGTFGGTAEANFTIFGELRTSDAVMLGILNGQQAIGTNRGIVSLQDGTIIPWKNVQIHNKIPTKGDYSEIFMEDGSSVIYSAKTAKNTSYLEIEKNNHGFTELMQENLFFDAKDVAMYNENFGFGKKIGLNLVPESYLNYGKIVEQAKRDGFILIDYKNASNVAYLDVINLELKNNGKVKLKSYDAKKETWVETEIEYVVDHKSIQKGDVPIGVYDADYKSKTKEESTSTINPDAPEIYNESGTGWIRRKIIRLKEYAKYEGESIPPNKGLGENHLANINLDKFPAELRPMLKEVMNQLGTKQIEEFKGFRGFEETLMYAKSEQNMKAFLDAALFEGPGKIILKDGKVNPLLRINDIDVVTAKIVLQESLKLFTEKPTDANKKLLQQLIKVNIAVGEVSGRTLGSNRISVNGVEVGNIKEYLELNETELFYIDRLLSGKETSATYGEMLVELRRNNLLTSTGSLVRSVFGNYVGILIKFPEKVISGVQGEMMKKLNDIIGKGDWKPQENRQLADIWHFSEGTARGMGQGFKTGVRILFFEDMKAVTQSALYKREMIHEGAIPGKLGVIIRTPQRSQMFLDVILRVPAEKGFLYEYAGRQARSERLKGQEYVDRVKELTKDPEFIGKWEKMAAADAEYITYQQQLGKWGEMVNKTRAGEGSVPVQMVIPFFNTAVNLFKFTVDHSPFRALTPTYYRAAKKGLTEGKWGEWMDYNSRMVTGTTAMWWLSSTLVPGEVEHEGNWKDLTESERNTRSSLGYQPNSIRFYNEDGSFTSVSTVGFEPLNMMFSMAGAYSVTQDEEIGVQLEAVIGELFNAYRTNPFLQGTDELAGVLDGTKDPMTYMTRLASSTFIPNIIMQAGKIQDDIRYQPHYTDELFVDMFKVDEWHSRFSQQFGFVEGSDDIPKLDIWGRPVRVADPVGATYAMRLTESEDDPNYTEMSKEMLRLMPALGDFSFEKHQYGKIDLTDKQKFLLQISSSQNFYGIMKKQMLDEGGNLKESWIDMPDKAKVKLVRMMKERIMEAQLMVLSGELKLQGMNIPGAGMTVGESELIDMKDLIMKQGENILVREDVVDVLTKKYRESEAGAVEIKTIEKMADEVILEIRKGKGVEEALEGVYQKYPNAKINNKE